LCTIKAIDTAGPATRYNIENEFGFSKWVYAGLISECNPKFKVGDYVKTNALFQRTFPNAKPVNGQVGNGAYWDKNCRSFVYPVDQALLPEKYLVEDVREETEKDETSPKIDLTLIDAIDELEAPKRELLRLFLYELKEILYKYKTRIEVGSDFKIRIRMRFGEHEECYTGPKMIKDITSWTSFREEIPNCFK
jgi:hypothetical protein